MKVTKAVTIQTYPDEVPPIMAWDVEAALRKMKNGNEAGKDQVNIETLKAVDDTIAKQLVNLFTKCITERRIPKHGRKQIWGYFSRKGTKKKSRTTDQFACYQICTICSQKS